MRFICFSDTFQMRFRCVSEALQRRPRGVPEASKSVPEGDPENRPKIAPRKGGNLIPSGLPKGTKTVKKSIKKWSRNRAPSPEGPRGAHRTKKGHFLASYQEKNRIFKMLVECPENLNFIIITHFGFCHMSISFQYVFDFCQYINSILF